MTLAFRIEDIASIDSTNNACRLRAEMGEPEGLVIRADRQTAGRGRRGRPWESPVGNLYCSLLLRPARPAKEVATLGFAVVAALGNVVADLLPAERVLGHKWPNDLLIDGRKASGLLLEAGPSAGPSIDWLVIGMGVNIVSHPPDTPYQATDLEEMGCAPIASRSLLERFLSAFSSLHALWERHGFPAISRVWMDRAHGVGGSIEVRLEGETLHGRFHSLDSDGALVLELPTREFRRIAAGDVYFPGPSVAQTSS
jgi:BirA family biotin operon repressor/biotin-[acetyl-CoA-carboxylase] ligase